MKSLKTALINIRRMPYKSLIAISMIAITFFVAYSFSLLMVGSQKVLDFFETKPTVIAFFKIKTNEEDVKNVQNAIESLNYVESVKVISKDEALVYYQEKQDNPLLLELVTADILPASIEISTIDPDYLPKVEQELTKMESIDEIVLQKDVVNQLVEWTRSLRMVGLVTISFLVLLSFFIISSTISFKIGNQGRLVGILRIIGASSGYIITPYIYEGFIYGLLGSIIGWSLTYACFLYLSPWLSSFVGEIISFPVPWEFFAVQLGLGTSLGLFFGGTASILAGKRLIKK